ncbi:MAG: response regulator [Elainellaceae cyanobacterium]
MMDLSEYGILLVEDSSSDIVFIQRAFKQANIVNPIRVVRDGDEVIAYLSGEGDYGDRSQYPLPAMILLDLKLPRRDGLEVLDWLKQQPSLKRIPVVVLTSSREAADVDRAYDLGVSSYLVKPVQLEALNNMVEAINTYWLRFNQFPNLFLA